jgi:uncharacterized coiled-coil DUF342 family protein
MPSFHEVLRLVHRIHAAYERRATCQHQPGAWRRLEHRFQKAQQLQQMTEKARLRAWHLAANQQQRHLQSALRALNDSVREVQEALFETRQHAPCLNDLLAELRNLESEFNEVIFDKKSFLAVHTESINLENINLGRFFNSVALAVLCASCGRRLL